MLEDHPLSFTRILTAPLEMPGLLFLFGERFYNCIDNCIYIADT